MLLPPLLHSALTDPTVKDNGALGRFAFGSFTASERRGSLLISPWARLVRLRLSLLTLLGSLVVQDLHGGLVALLQFGSAFDHMFDCSVTVGLFVPLTLLFFLFFLLTCRLRPPTSPFVFKVPSIIELWLSSALLRFIAFTCLLALNPPV